MLALYFVSVPGIATPPRSAALKTYHATNNGDGTFTIHDVEIVGPVRAGDRPDSRRRAPEIGKAWMERVLATHLNQLVGGYVAPVHLEHHGDGAKSPAVGTFVPMRVGVTKIDGEDVDVLFGDVTVDAATLASIQRGEHPYRSIEVEEWDRGLVASLALMSSTAPYSRLPMLRNVVVDAAPLVPGEELPLDVAALSVLVPTKRAKGFRDVTARLRADAIVRLAYAKSGDEDEPTDENGDELGKEPPAKGKSDGDEDDDAGDGFEPEAGAGAEAEEGRWAAVMKALQAILKAVTGGQLRDDVQPARDEDPNTTGEDTPIGDDEHEKNDAEARKPAKEKAKMAAQNATLDAETKATLATLTAKVTTLETQNATLASENASLKTRLDASDAKIKCDAFVVAATARLRAKRVQPPATFAATIAKLHAKGEDLAEAYVADLETSGRQDPPERFTDEIGSASSAPDEAELGPYRAAGAAKLEAALKVQREYRQLKAQTPGSQTTLAEMLKIRVPLVQTQHATA